MPDNLDDMTIRQLQRLLGTTSKVVAVTGSGVSAESGIPTFRDSENGLWNQYSPYELASPDAFLRDKDLVWGWYEWRRNLINKAHPNPGHLVLAEMQRHFDDFTLVTQNVDDLHERAGSQGVVHLHGEIMRPRCFSCGHAYQHSESSDAAAEPMLRISPPTCSRCDGFVRPGVVWFGESLSEDAWNAAATAAQSCDVLFCLGTSGLVHPAAGLPQLARRSGATVIQINPQETALDSDAHYNLRGNNGRVLPELFRRLVANADD